MKSQVKAFTLIEALFAMTILALGVIALLALFGNVIFLNTANRNLTVATTHAEYILEATRNKNFSTIQNQAWDSAAIAALGLTPLDTESISLTKTGTDPLDVIATVSWQDRGLINRSISMETLITEQ